jgi:hypothetical protein
MAKEVAPIAALVLAMLVAVPAFPQQDGGTQRSPTRGAAAEPAAEGKAHLEATMVFLRAWAKERWKDARPVAADEVPLKIGERTYAIDVAGGTTDAKLVGRFRGLSVIREGGKPVGVEVEEVRIRTDAFEKRGRAHVATEEQGGKVRVTAIAFDEE